MSFEYRDLFKDEGRNAFISKYTNEEYRETTWDDLGNDFLHGLYQQCFDLDTEEGIRYESKLDQIGVDPNQKQGGHGSVVTGSIQAAKAHHPSLQGIFAFRSLPLRGVYAPPYPLHTSSFSLLDDLPTNNQNDENNDDQDKNSHLTIEPNPIDPITNDDTFIYTPTRITMNELMTMTGNIQYIPNFTENDFLKKKTKIRQDEDEDDEDEDDDDNDDDDEKKSKYKRQKNNNNNNNAIINNNKNDDNIGKSTFHKDIQSKSHDELITLYNGSPRFDVPNAFTYLHHDFLRFYLQNQDIIFIKDSYDKLITFDTISSLKSSRYLDKQINKYFPFQEQRFSMYLSHDDQLLIQKHAYIETIATFEQILRLFDRSKALSQNIAYTEYVYTSDDEKKFEKKNEKNDEKNNIKKKPTILEILEDIQSNQVISVNYPLRLRQLDSYAPLDDDIVPLMTTTLIKLTEPLLLQKNPEKTNNFQNDENFNQTPQNSQNIIKYAKSLLSNTLTTETLSKILSPHLLSAPFRQVLEIFPSDLLCYYSPYSILYPYFHNYGNRSEKVALKTALKAERSTDNYDGTLSYDHIRELIHLQHFSAGYKPDVCTNCINKHLLIKNPLYIHDIEYQQIKRKQIKQEEKNKNQSQNNNEKVFSLVDDETVNAAEELTEALESALPFSNRYCLCSFHSISHGFEQNKWELYRYLRLNNVRFNQNSIQNPLQNVENNSNTNQQQQQSGGYNPGVTMGSMMNQDTRKAEGIKRSLEAQAQQYTNNELYTQRYYEKPYEISIEQTNIEYVTYLSSLREVSTRLIRPIIYAEHYNTTRLYGQFGDNWEYLYHNGGLRDRYDNVLSTHYDLLQDEKNGGKNKNIQMKYSHHFLHKPLPYLYPLTYIYNDITHIPKEYNEEYKKHLKMSLLHEYSLYTKIQYDNIVDLNNISTLYTNTNIYHKHQQKEYLIKLKMKEYFYSFSILEKLYFFYNNNIQKKIKNDNNFFENFYFFNFKKYSYKNIIRSLLISHNNNHNEDDQNNIINSLVFDYLHTHKNKNTTPSTTTTTAQPQHQPQQVKNALEIYQKNKHTNISKNAHLSISSSLHTNLPLIITPSNVLFINSHNVIIPQEEQFTTSMELMKLDLTKLIKHSFPYFTPYIIKRVFWMCCQSLALLHRRFYIHRDLKPDNYLIRLPLEPLQNRFEIHKLKIKQNTDKNHDKNNNNKYFERNQLKTEALDYSMNNNDTDNINDLIGDNINVHIVPHHNQNNNHQNNQNAPPITTFYALDPLTLPSVIKGPYDDNRDDRIKEYHGIIQSEHTQFLKQQREQALYIKEIDKYNAQIGATSTSSVQQQNNNYRSSNSNFIQQSQYQQQNSTSTSTTTNTTTAPLQIMFPINILDPLPNITTNRHNALPPPLSHYELSNLICHLADFGGTKEYDNPHGGRQIEMSPQAFTVWYRPPELLMYSKNYSYQADIWALGCILGELFLGRPLFDGYSPHLFPGLSESTSQLRFMYYILGPPSEADWPEIEALPACPANLRNASLKDKRSAPFVGLDRLLQNRPFCTSDGMNLLKMMLSWNPRRRPNIEEILQHEFFDEIRI